MPYLNVDDSMDEHRKIDGLSDKAFRLLMASMLYCARTKSDGFVPLAKARRLTVTGTDAVAAELVRAGVWHDLGEGCDKPACIEAKTCHRYGREGHYIVHDYLEWNHSRHWWEQRAADEAERKRKWRAKSRTESRRTSRGTGRGTDDGRDAGQDAGRDATEPEPEPEPEPIPTGSPNAVDHSSPSPNYRPRARTTAASGGKEIA